MSRKAGGNCLAFGFFFALLLLSAAVTALLQLKSSSMPSFLLFLLSLSMLMPSLSFSSIGAGVQSEVTRSIDVVKMRDPSLSDFMVKTVR